MVIQGLIQEEIGMNYRELGKTGLKLSEIGLGCEGFVDADDALSDAIFELALQNGVNCLDMYTPDPAAQKRSEGESHRSEKTLSFRVISAPSGKMSSMKRPENCRK